MKYTYQWRTPGGSWNMCKKPYSLEIDADIDMRKFERYMSEAGHTVETAIVEERIDIHAYTDRANLLLMQLERLYTDIADALPYVVGSEATTLMCEHDKVNRAIVALL